MAHRRWRIRTKVLILLLLIALVPLLVGVTIQRLQAFRLGQELARGSRTILIEGVQRQLRTLVDHYGTVLDRDEMILRLIIRLQAEAVSEALRQPPAAPAAGPFDPDRFGYDPCVPARRRPYRRYLDPEHDPGAPETYLSYQRQSFFLATGVDEARVRGQLHALAALTPTLFELYQHSPDFIFWQYTCLADGVHVNYPGGGELPDPTVYDPRRRTWYTRAHERNETAWSGPFVDAASGNVIVTLSTPVRGPDEAFAGVTALDVILGDLFRTLELPPEWRDHAESMIVVPRPPEYPASGDYLVLAKTSYLRHGTDWQEPFQLETFENERMPIVQEMMADAANGGAGIRALPYRGQRCLWAYGRMSAGTAVPMVVIPYDRVVEQAVQAEKLVMHKTIVGLTITGVILVFVAAGAVWVALASGKAVTEPINQLAEAAHQLAAGDYRAAVDIHTGDELEELGRVFNDLGPQLQERERMKRSLAVATAIQQHLLPDSAPRLAHFDLAGHVHYCDETGGDYYDFIDLIEVAPGKFAVAVGDITGHGLPAAFLMASARGVLRSHALHHGANLPRLLTDFNRHLVHDMREGRFLTLFYGLLDDEQRSLVWAAGGHDPALWYRAATGHIEDMPNTGLPLGITEDADYTQCGPVHFERGDVVLIGTDGIWETRNPAGEMFGKQRLRELLATRHGRPAQAIYQAVIDAVVAFRDAAPQTDDITLVVLRCS